MSFDKVRFRIARGPSQVQVRELNGFDEQSVNGVDTVTTINLLDRVIVLPPGSSSEAFRAARLTASDRDRLLAVLYERTYGPRIESTVRCTICESLFDLSFSIRQLFNTLEAASTSSSAAEPQPDGTFRMPDGARFRLPTGEDELSVAGLLPEEAERALLQRCLIEPSESVDLNAIEEAMEVVAPVLDLDLDAQCPECGGKQAVHFDLQSYLLRSISQERKKIAHEIHRLAVAYGWSLNEILSLPRSLRQTFMELIEADLSAQQRAYS